MNALHRLLDAHLRLPPEYREQLTNHLPMALHALQEMGADEARMHAFFATYAARFAGLPDVPALPVAATSLPAAAWTALRGQPAACATLRAHFEWALASQAADEVLRQTLPALLPGVAGAAFHGLIRTAHAVQSGHRGELAAALAYWAWRWMPLAPAAAGPPMAFDEWTKALMTQAADWRPEPGLISDRMRHALDAPAYQALGGRLRIAPETLPGLSAFAARRYAETGNFTVLHLVTSCRAARVLMPWMNPEQAMAELSTAYAAAYLASGVGTVRSPGPDAVPGWPMLVQQAIAADDDHVIKLVHACRDEAAAYGCVLDPGLYPYRAAAARALA